MLGVHNILFNLGKPGNIRGLERIFLAFYRTLLQSRIYLVKAHGGGSAAKILPGEIQNRHAGCAKLQALKVGQFVNRLGRLKHTCPAILGSQNNKVISTNFSQ